MSGLSVAVRIRCAGRGRRCSRQIGAAALVPRPKAGRPVLLLSNEGWPLSNGYPVLMTSVPGDFSGSSGILGGCKDHGAYWEGEPTGPPRFRGFPPAGVRWMKGSNVQFPFDLLKEPYARALRTGLPQTIQWAPGVSPTTIVDDG